MLHARSSLGGMVTAPHHLAAASGAAILKEGGNAIEAMVAAAATIAVVYPHMNGLGGDGFWIISEPGKAPVGIQACGQAAARATKDFYQNQGCHQVPARGPLAALTVPGAVGGWSKALETAASWGARVPLERLLSDAINHANRGIPVTPSQSHLSAAKYAELAPVPGFAPVFLPNDSAPAVGSVLTQQAMGKTLLHLAKHGLNSFYHGALADTHDRFLTSVGSPLRRADFDRYEAKTVNPLSVSLSVGSAYNMPPPTQGVSSLMILGLYDRLIQGHGAHEADGFHHLHLLVEATKQAFILRNEHVTDPSRMAVNPKDWLTESALQALVQAVDPVQALPWPHEPREGDTIWMGACDSHGRMVSYIQSVYWEFGSGLTCPDTGVIFQNRGASFTLDDGPNSLQPSTFPFHTLNPAYAELSDGRRMVYGTMGGEGQPQTQSALFSRYAYHQQDIQQAITAPRWLLGRTWGEESTTLKLEDRFTPQVIDHLKSAGHAVETLGPFDNAMGHAGALVLCPSGVIQGATDPRADGACHGL